jgi:3-oxoacyl-[acyl-carrier protein] reductase
MHIDLTGQAILVTGSSRGIGLAIAEGLAESGATVAVHYRQSRDAAEALAARLGRGARAFGADLADPPAAVRLWADVAHAYGRVHGLVNNAGIYAEAPVDLSAEEWLARWRATMDVNLTSTALLCKEALGHFQAQGGGRIVNIASRAAFRGDTPDYIAYAASKGGMVALTRTIARGFGKQGVTAFVVAPGFTRTDMADAFLAVHGEDFATGDIALNRLTEPGDIAPIVTLLLSGLADHATGTSIDVNAGSYVR